MIENAWETYRNNTETEKCLSRTKDYKRLLIKQSRPPYIMSFLELAI